MKLYKVIAIVILISFTTVAKDNSDKKTFLIAQIDMPQVLKFKPLIIKLYEEIGYEVSFIKMPSIRAMKMLERGELDASLIHSKGTLSNNENVIIIPTAITQGVFVLLCADNLICNKKVLEDSSNQVLATNSSQQLYKRDGGATFITMETLISYPELIQKERYNYAIYAYELSEEQLPKNLNYIELERKFGYHVVAKKHAHLVNFLDNKLKKLLKKTH
jgi:hypothetical protein